VSAVPPGTGQEHKTVRAQRFVFKPGSGTAPPMAKDSDKEFSLIELQGTDTIRGHFGTKPSKPPSCVPGHRLVLPIVLVLSANTASPESDAYLGKLEAPCFAAAGSLKFFADTMGSFRAGGMDAAALESVLLRFHGLDSSSPGETRKWGP